MSVHMPPIRLCSCQAPAAFPACRAIAQYLTERLSLPMVFVEQGHWQNWLVDLERGVNQIGWVCGTWYARLQQAVRLLAAPVAQGPLYQDQPVYFSHMVVRSDSVFQSFTDLRGARLAYNERGSHSGYNVVRYHLARIGEYSGFFGRVIEAGSHQSALDLILTGRIDAAAIDSTVLDVELRDQPQLADAIRIVETLGPSPMPPWVSAISLPEVTHNAIQQALLHLHEDKAGRAVLELANFTRFAAISDTTYDTIRQMTRIAQSVTL